jgi:hypothetical protein
VSGVDAEVTKAKLFHLHDDHGCLLTEQGGLRCWGDYSYNNTDFDRNLEDIEDIHVGSVQIFTFRKGFIVEFVDRRLNLLGNDWEKLFKTDFTFCAATANEVRCGISGKTVLRVSEATKAEATEHVYCAMGKKDFDCYNDLSSDKIKYAHIAVLRKLAPVEDFCIGTSRLCIIKDGKVVCRGGSETTDLPPPQQEMMPLPPEATSEMKDLTKLTNATHLFCKGDLLCAKNNGTWSCEGEYKLGPSFEEALSKKPDFIAVNNNNEYCVAAEGKLTCSSSIGPPPAYLKNFSSVQVGIKQACAIQDGKVICWGNTN